MFWITALNGQLVNLARAHAIKLRDSGAKPERWELEAWFGSDSAEAFSMTIVVGTREQCAEFRQVLFSRLKAAQESPESC